MGQEVTLRLPRSIEKQLLDGTMTCFSRPTVVGDTGDYFDACGHRFVITRVARMRMDDAKYRLWEKHGYTAWSQWDIQWDADHPKNQYKPDKYVWVHFFKMVK